FIRSSVIVTTLLALIFFPEERWIIRQWQFQVGTLLGLVGAVGVLWFQPGREGGPIALRGIAVAFTASFCWALYSVLVKRLSPRSFLASGSPPRKSRARPFCSSERFWPCASNREQSRNRLKRCRRFDSAKRGTSSGIHRQSRAFTHDRSGYGVVRV